MDAQKETDRLKALHDLDILDSDDEVDFDHLALLASNICETPVSLITLIDSKRQWFKAKVGTEVKETDRSVSFCTYAIEKDEIMKVENMLEDQRFVKNPLVENDPKIRSYFGRPIKHDNQNIGTLCVLDLKPRKLSDQQLEALDIIAHQVELVLSLKKLNIEYNKILDTRKKMSRLVVHDMKNPLTIISLSTQVLESVQEGQSEVQKRYLDSIKKSGEHLMSLVNKFLDLAEETNLKDSFIKNKFDLKKLGEETCGEMEQLLRENQRLVFEGDDVSVVSDRLAVQRMIENLVSNSIKYSGNNSEISVQVNNQENKKTLVIKDNGPGLSEENKKALLEWSENKKSDKISHGIGLNYIASAVENLGIDFKFEDEKPSGCKFIFEF